jgi:hypothetical protein
MVRTQVQLPDEIYARAKQLAAAREVSLTELMLRGLELVLSQDLPMGKIRESWQPPIVQGLGWKGLSHEQIKAAAQQSALEDELESQAEQNARV